MRLSDQGAPFYFQAGERVAWRRWDGAPDREFQGIVMDAIGTFTLPGGSYRAVYTVRRDDGYFFKAGEAALVQLSADYGALQTEQV